MFAGMKISAFLIALIAAAGLAAPASAACYADYKAKRDAPLQLHYGVIELPEAACNDRDAEAEVALRIAADGWQLLAVLSIFEDDGLDSRAESAGQFNLRY